MEVAIYTLTKKDADEYGGMLPWDLKYRLRTPGYYALGAVGEDCGLVGVLVYYIGVMTDPVGYAKVSYIYVDDDYRRQGIGTGLMEKACRILESAGIIEISALLPVVDSSTTLAKDFFAHLGFTFNSEKVREYHGRLGELVTEDFRKKESAMKAKPINVLDQKSFAALFMRILQQKDLTNSRYAFGAELKPDIDAYDPYLSTFYSNSGGEGLFLVSRIGPEAVEKSFLRTYGENAQEGLFDLVMMSIKHAQITLEPDAEVFIGNISYISRMIIDEFAPNARPVFFEKGLRLLGSHT